MKTKKILSALILSAFALSSGASLALAQNGRSWDDFNNGRGRSGSGYSDRDSRWQSSYITPHIRQTQSLSENNQRYVNDRIDQVPSVQRLDYLLTILIRIEELRINIEESSRSAAKKTRLINLLDGIAEVIQDRIDRLIWNDRWVDDNTAPVTLSFNVSNVGTNSAMISMTVDEAWKGYFVVLPSGEAAPSVTQVRALQDANGNPEPISATNSLVAGANQFSITGLMQNTSYSVYFVAEDTFENIQSGLTTRSFTTLATGGSGGDTTPPVTSSVSFSGTTNSGGTLRVTSNEAGTLYSVILLSGSTAPTAVQVKAWQDSSGTVASMHSTYVLTSGENQFPITGLSLNTDYVAYLVAQDTAGNLQGSVTSVALKTVATVDSTAPTSSGLNVTNIGSGSATANVTVNEAGNGYFVVLSSGAMTPTSAQVKAWKDGSGATASLYGSNTTVVGSNQFSMTGLTANTNYTLYFAAEDTAGNLETTPVSMNFMTTGSIADTTPPVTSALSFSGITSTGTMLHITSNEPGLLYNVTLLSGSTAPTPAQVKAWEDASGTLASINWTFTLAVGDNQFSLTGLAPATNYVSYFVAEDMSGNLQTTVTSSPLVTP